MATTIIATPQVCYLATCYVRRTCRATKLRQATILGVTDTGRIRVRYAKGNTECIPPNRVEVRR